MSNAHLPFYLNQRTHHFPETLPSRQPHLIDQDYTAGDAGKLTFPDCVTMPQMWQAGTQTGVVITKSHCWVGTAQG